MSAIVAVEGQGGVALAWDTRVTIGDSVDHGLDKAWLIRPWLGLGLAGDVAPCQAVRYGWTPKRQPRGSEASLAFWVHRQTSAWRAIVAPFAEGAASSDGDRGLPSAIIAVGGIAFSVAEDLSIVRSPRRYTAIGTGQGWCEGYLWRVLRGPRPIEHVARDRAREAVLAAAEHCVSVGGEVRTLWVLA